MESLKLKGKIFIFMLLLFLATGINYKYFKSLNEQKILMVEWQVENLKEPIENVLEFEDEIPNITITTMPIKYLKSRYLIYNEKFEKQGFDMLIKSDKGNPYLAAKESELALYHLNKKMDLDSAYYFTKKSIEILPTDINLVNFFNISYELEKYYELDSVFKKYKNEKSEFLWREYILKKVNIKEENKDENLKSIFNEAKLFFKDRKVIDYLESILEVGELDIGKYKFIIAEADFLFENKNFKKAAELYLEASLLNNKDKSHIYNIAKCYFNNNNFKDALFYFHRYVNENPFLNPEAYLYLGVSYSQLDQNNEACNYLSKAFENKVPGSIQFYRLSCN